MYLPELDDRAVPFAIVIAGDRGQLGSDDVHSTTVLLHATADSLDKAIHITK